MSHQLTFADSEFSTKRRQIKEWLNIWCCITAKGHINHSN